MITTVSEYAGFCPGVKRADREIRRLIDSYDGKIFTLGKLIHNRLYVEELETLGVKSIDISELELFLENNPDLSVMLVIRTHGVTKEIMERLEKFKVLYPFFDFSDMTCPYVNKIHDIAKNSTSDDTVFLLYCDKTHPEAIATISYARGEKYMFSSYEELQTINFKGKIPILCAQTTQNLLEFLKIKKNFKKLYTNTKIFDTICNVTENRQNDAISLAKKCDAMIVIGGKDSSNTHKLYDLCAKECPMTLWIESLRDLTDFPDSAKCVGIAAGASTPEGIITEVLDFMEDKNMNFAEMVEGSIKTLHTGETVTGTIYNIGENEIALDLGAKVTGVLKRTDNRRYVR